jgi:hypothetical protein
VERGEASGSDGLGNAGRERADHGELELTINGGWQMEETAARATPRPWVSIYSRGGFEVKRTCSGGGLSGLEALDGEQRRRRGGVADGQVVLDACGQLVRPAAASRGQNQGLNQANPKGFAVPGAPA